MFQMELLYNLLDHLLSSITSLHYQMIFNCSCTSSDVLHLFSTDDEILEKSPRWCKGLCPILPVLSYLTLFAVLTICKCDLTESKPLLVFCPLIWSNPPGKFALIDSQLQATPITYPFGCFQCCIARPQCVSTTVKPFSWITYDLISKNNTLYHCRKESFYSIQVIL